LARRRQNATADKPEEQTHIDLQEGVSLNFALRYMNSFAKATPLSNQARTLLPFAMHGEAYACSGLCSVVLAFACIAAIPACCGAMRCACCLLLHACWRMAACIVNCHMLRGCEVCMLGAAQSRWCCA
jgi:hypothetical protein